MIRAFRSELVKLLRRRVLLVTALVTAVFSVGGAALVLTSAEPGRSADRDGRALTIDDLSRAGGGTEVFTSTISFAGTFLFVVFVGAVAAEFSRGTIRTMLLRQPARVRLLAGKTVAMLTFAAAVLAGMEALTWTAAWLLAPGQDVTTADWASLAAVGHALADYGAALFWVTGYALLGTLVGVLVRSVPVALAVGAAWAGPFEHLLQDAWDPASRIFPGLLLEAFVAGGTPDVTAGQAFATLSGYLALAAAAAGLVFSRRDVTTA
jgi:ABC-2 type transport system permease protein